MIYLTPELKLLKFTADEQIVEKADKTLEDLRKTGALVESTAIYYAAVNLKIKYLIETGPQAAWRCSYIRNRSCKPSKIFPAKSCAGRYFKPFKTT